MKPRDLQNDPQKLHGGLRALLERSENGLGVSSDASRTLQGAPGVLDCVFLEALGISWVAFLMMFLVYGGTGSENDEMLENDDPLYENAKFWVSQGPQHETNLVSTGTESAMRSQSVPSLAFMCSSECVRV